MFYGKYKQIRNSAWQCLVDFEIESLPVDIIKIARLSNIRVVKNSEVDILQGDEKGRAFYDGDEWIIIYDDKLPVPSARMTVAHELGHIFLGHETEYAKYYGIHQFKKLPACEKQADDFAVRLLCPSCVIWGLGLNSAEEITDYCKLEMPIAKKRYNRMKTLYARNKFLTMDIEKALYANFRNYIKEETSSKDVK